MKQTTIHAMLISRSLLERARPLCLSEDRYLASAGLVILQDCLEMVFYALLIEIGVDETKNLESKSFDELLAELKTAGIAIPKSGTIKALNKQRVLTKHYAQPAEPATVGAYLEAAELVLDAVVTKVLGKPLRELFLSDFLKDGEAKLLLKTAESLVNKGQYLLALIEIRKAIFLEFEMPYSIHGWKDIDENENAPPSLMTFARGGWKAPYWKRNRQWIEKHVSDPTEFVQIDADDWRVQALEYGIHTAELANLQRLTPSVFRVDKDASWAIKYNASFPPNEANAANAKYCLDRAISIVLKKQEHAGTTRQPARGAIFNPPQIYVDQKVYERATTNSKVVHTVSEHFTYEIQEYVDGFGAGEKFFYLRAESIVKNERGWPKDWAYGYLLVQDEVVPESEPKSA